MGGVLVYHFVKNGVDSSLESLIFGCESIGIPMFFAMFFATFYHGM